jgi:menaquinone-dependent protoporphyrinogen oxidase
VRRPTSVLALYGTTEGQTRKVVRFLADRLAARCCAATLVDASEAPADLDPGAFDAAMIAASLHLGRYQAAVEHFVRRHHAVLAAMPNVFVSVSLSAASDDADDLDGLARCAAEFADRTLWQPQETRHVAGAFRFTQYGFLKRWAMKYIAHRKGQPTDASRDYELTDWTALAAFADRFADRLPAGRASAARLPPEGGNSR